MIVNNTGGAKVTLSGNVSNSSPANFATIFASSDVEFTGNLDYGQSR